uniref:lectin n=1 Tax=Xerocomellus chrysenteron TaxID=1354920 RepID=UPI00005AB3AF|nr:Chain A, lectin [Xerocomellus chrysenteron]1XI0_B Chain B, lectin [Xerocomellus chrysenteron]
GHMSYSITLRVYQTNRDRGYFSIVEKTVWHFANGGTWSEANGAHTLTQGGSGTSGVLRFLSTKGERITVAVGVHNYKRWCDVVTGLKPDETALVINPQYYNNGGRDYVREKQLAEYSVTSAIGTKVEVVYTVAEGNNLEANVIFS